MPLPLWLRYATHLYIYIYIYIYICFDTDIEHSLLVKIINCTLFLRRIFRSLNCYSKDRPESTQKIRETVKTTCHDSSSLTNRDISNKYTVTVRNKFDTPLEIFEKHTPNEEYENLIHAYIETAPECIITKPRAKQRVPWETVAVRKN